MGPMLTSSNVYWAFANRGYVTDPEYVKAVIRNYVHFKAQRGKSKTEISMKLECLEREFPQFAYAFRAIRQEYSLSPSRILPAPRVTSSSASNNSNLRRTQTATTPSRTSNNNTITRTHTTVGATTNRATTNNDDEPPPPPYQSQDPDPASTRILQESLAAEAELRGTLPGQTTSTPTTATSHNTSPPTSAATQPRTAGSANAEVDDGPQRVPSDPELARIWEESQFEEAKRASLAWQVEQQELQEAMRLSLAESESRGEGSSSGTAGPSNARPISTIPETQSIGGTSSHGSDMRDLVEGIGDMITPGSYNSVHPSASTSDSDNQNNNQQLQNLLDEQSSSYTGQTPLTPQKTGFHIQSKNPFLSSNEKEQLQAMEQAALHDQSHPAPSDQLAQQHTPPPMTAGSSYTHYTPPSEPSQQLYTPPPGPPPSHLRIVTPTSPTSRPLPATPKDQFPWNGSSSPSNGNGTLSSPISHNQPYLSSPVAESHNSLHQTLQGTPPTLPARRKSFVPPPGKEDALEMLKDFDTVFLVDDSTSMAGDRWSEARQALMEVAEIAARYDENGVDIYFLNSKRVGKELRAAHEVEDLFRGLEPKGATPTGMRLESILREYMARLERSRPTSPTLNGGGSSDASVKPMNLIIVTDGAPTDDPESVIISIAKRLDRGEYPLSQVGVQFLQIGNDSEAREALQELDDGLSAAHGVRDIVDTVLYDGEDMSAGLIIKTLLGGINRRLDRRSPA
ncbi:hypothetical protein L486_01820 [Kwoniella mangroviensis CBS 10435]|uniref:VWFA domain-containing protein n=1 Tax=Kwoniella mangroviensis CBS 10435 TaxID=1331196 RepID=A0A1B9J2Y3_9TREE|nr:uncharacterized protein I203_03516 [Kwoniella mangroviensis CBS 8507]OCF62153.1 hypothetical protein L486_01820 [Kwoniella mangroviensis CBS 10435]OCF66835.1 hypothetical protein I203_03516 [Kwoniella mangroviensis CBS 8507]